MNEAFVISQATRDQLVADDSRSTKLIKPWIRGRDLGRWTHEYHEHYVIIVPFGFAEELKKFPAILKHLKQFERELKARGQCQNSRDGSGEGQHHWLELDNNPLPEYLAAFDSNCIVYADIGKHMKAFVSKDGVRFGNTAYFIPNAEPWLLSLLLSSPLDYVYRHLMQPLGDPWTNGRLRFFSRSVKDVPIPPATPADKARLSQLAEACAAAAQRGDDATLAVHEAEIDQIVYRLFDLTPEEIALIESALTPTRTSMPKRKRSHSTND